MVIKVLIVDDFEDIRESLRISLEGIDPSYEISEAKDAEECFEKIKGDKPDVVLMDIMLPGMSGMEAASKIKQDIETKNIRIIYITAKDDSETKSMASIIGEGFIQKPFEAKAVDKKIKEVMDKKSPVYAKKS